MNIRIKLAAWLAGAVAVVLGLGGCSSSKKIDRADALAPRFHVEAGPGAPGVPVVLPVSDARIRVTPQPVLTEYDVTRVELVSGGVAPALRFELTPAAAQALERLSATSAGRRLVLVIRGEAVGVRVLEEPITDGRVVVFVERPEATVATLATRLQRSLALWQREAARK